MMRATSLLFRILLISAERSCASARRSSAGSAARLVNVGDGQVKDLLGPVQPSGGDKGLGNRQRLAAEQVNHLDDIMLGRFAVSAKGQPGLVIFFQRPGFVFAFFQRNFIERLIGRFALGAGLVEKRAGAIHRQRHIFELLKEQGGLFAAGAAWQGQFRPGSASQIQPGNAPSGAQNQEQRNPAPGRTENPRQWRKRLISGDDGQGVHHLAHFRRLVARQRNPQVDQMILHLRRFLLEQALDALLGDLRRQDHRDAIVAIKEGQQVGERDGLRLQGTAIAGKRFKTPDFLGQGSLVFLQDVRRAGDRLRAPR